MKADILIKDVNESPCIVTIHYSRFFFDSWFSGSKPIGAGISGDCSVFGPTSIHLRDGNDILNLDLGVVAVPMLQIQAGKSGKGWVKSSGFLKSGDIIWQVWNTRRTGAFGDGLMKEGAIN